jgi:hypothetical protein
MVTCRIPEMQVEPAVTLTNRITHSPAVYVTKSLLLELEVHVPHPRFLL